MSTIQLPWQLTGQLLKNRRTKFELFLTWWAKGISGKMVVLSLIVSPEGAVCSRRVPIWWGAHAVKAVDRYKHVKFLGGNANPVGGFTFLKNIALKWSGVIIAKLMIWPPSYGVAKAVIEGLLMNRLIGRVVVNTPPDG